MLGVHVSKISTVLEDKKSYELENAIPRDLNAYGLNCAQIFTFGPTFIKKNKYNAKAILNETKEINLSVHSAYASTKIWKIADDSHISEKNKIIKTLMQQVESCIDIKAWGIVLHIGKVHPDDASYVMTLLKPHIKKTKIKLIIEMVAMKPDTIKSYETPEKINNLTNLIGDEKWWGWCIDTAHIWGAGIDVRDYDTVVDWFSKISNKNRILMIHLNGSFSELGSGKDKHEVPFSPNDKIWGNIDPNESGVKAIVEFATKYNIPMICEINRGSEEEIRKSISLIKGLF